MVTQQIPDWAKKHLKPEAFAEIDAAVKNAETKTSGEIVPMVVRRSCQTNPAAALLLMLAGLAVANPPDWIHLVLGALIAAVGLAGLLSKRFAYSNFVQDLDIQVQRRAQLEFYQAGLTATAGKTGILLFVSLAERRVVVLADIAIADKLPPETWDGVVSTITTSIKEGHLARGLVKAITDCGALLHPHFPHALDDRNELKDSLILAE